MASFVSKVPPLVERGWIKTELSQEAQEILTFNYDLIDKVAETIAMKVLPLSSMLAKDTSLKGESDLVTALIREAVQGAIQAGTDLGARIDDGCYSVEAAIGEFQDHDDDLKEIGPKEMRMSIDISIPLDEVFLKLPPKALRKAKRTWDKAVAETG